MQKIKFDFDATKERIYAPNSNVPIGAPVDQNGNIANDGNAYGIVLCKETENEKYWVRYNLVVMVAGYCDIIDAQAIWGDEYSAEAMAAMSDITFCDNHQLPTGGGGDDSFIVNIELAEPAEEGGTGTLVADKTAPETLAAYNAGKLVYAIVTTQDGGKFVCDLASAADIEMVSHSVLDFSEGAPVLLMYTADFTGTKWSISFIVRDIASGETLFSMSYTEQ